MAGREGDTPSTVPDLIPVSPSEDVLTQRGDEVNDNVTVEQEEEYLRRASVALMGRLDEGEGMDGERFALPLTGHL